MIGTELVLAIVLGTAVLHATWNALAKSVGDRWVSSALIGVVNGIGGVTCVLVFGMPAPSAWPYLLASAALQATYLVLLTRTYSYGDMSRLYPIARGTSPIVVTVVAVTLLREQLGLVSWIGLAVLIAGIAVLAFARGRPRAGAGLEFAVLTGLCIAAYTLADGVGVRLAENPGGYIGWMFALQAPLLLGVCWWRGGKGFVGRARRHALRGLLGGVLSVVSYGIVVWAQSRAPLALVSGLRETSVVWAVLIGRVFLGERLVRLEVIAVVAAAIGAALLQIGA